MNAIDTPALKHLIATFGSSQIIIGTDYPFAFHERTPVKRLLDAGLEPEIHESLVRGNARRFLGIDAVS